MPIGARIRQRREALGLTQRELADRTQMRQNIISRLEHGDTPNPGADVIRRLARALGVTADWLIGMYDEDDPAPHAILALSG